MFDFLFTQSVLIAIVVGGFLSVGLSLLMILGKNKHIIPGLKPRKWLGIVLSTILILCGGALFVLSITIAFRFHQALFTRWLLGFVLSVIILTIVFTFISYSVSSNAMDRIRKR